MNKKKWVKKVSQKLKGIGYFHILSVINILIDELRKEIIETKEVNIVNFGKFQYKIFEPRMIKNVRTGKMSLTKKYSALRFKVSRTIVKFLTGKNEKNAIK